MHVSLPDETPSHFARMPRSYQLTFVLFVPPIRNQYGRRIQTGEALPAARWLASAVNESSPPASLCFPAVSGTAIAAGTITVTDPQFFTVLLAIPIVLPAASEPFDIVQILLEQTATVWRDVVVTGLSTATKAALQIWYRT